MMFEWNQWKIWKKGGQLCINDHSVIAACRRAILASCLVILGFLRADLYSIVEAQKVQVQNPQDAAWLYTESEEKLNSKPRLTL